MNNPFEDYFKEQELTVTNKDFNSDDFIAEVMLRGMLNAIPIPDQAQGFKNATLYLLNNRVPGTVVLHAMSLIIEGFKTNETDED